MNPALDAGFFYRPVLTPMTPWASGLSPFRSRPAEPMTNNSTITQSIEASESAANVGALKMEIERWEAASLRLAAGPFVLDIGRITLHKLVGHARVEAGGQRLVSLDAASAELSGVKVDGPLDFTAQPTGDWSLAPLAAAAGVVRAEIVDAHLMFDAVVTVPLRHGQVNFDDATVEHIGPDSRMGVGQLGLYVDAANGRSYLYRFPSTPVAGVQYERRGAVLGPWVTDRGVLQLQEFVEGLLRQGPDGQGPGFTEQARLLLGRTALAGDVQLGDGKFAAPGVQADLAGRAQGRNAVRVHSEAVGGGITVEMPALSVRHALLNRGNMKLACDHVTGALKLRLCVEGGQLRLAAYLAEIKVSGVHVDLHG